jgi:hypothetical protein
MVKKYLTKLFIITTLVTSLEATKFDTLKGNADLGLKLYETKIKKSCNFIDGWNFANKHSQDEWEEIAQNEKFRAEISKICSIIDNSIKESWLPNLYQFVYQNANDSGVVPWEFYM